VSLLLRKTDVMQCVSSMVERKQRYGYGYGDRSGRTCRFLQVDIKMVELRGFEPLTYSVQGMYTNYGHHPLNDEVGRPFYKLGLNMGGGLL
jgi:hypothetical protein